MSEDNALLIDTVTRLFRDGLTEGMRRQAESDGWCGDLWTLIEEHGLPSLFLTDDQGGYGGGFQDAAVVARLAGHYAVPAPVIEALLAQRLMARAGIAAPKGLTTVALTADLTLEGTSVRGLACAVPWGHAADNVVVLATSMDDAQQRLAVVPLRGAIVTRNRNLADEPRDDIRFDKAAVTAHKAAGNDTPPQDQLAALRSAQMAGALESTLAQSIQYANERVQFGKPIGKFQVVQQQLALMAEEAAAAVCSAGAACHAADRGNAAFEIAAAKLRVNRAADVSVPIAHQIHGAIGFTQEHSLRRWTQRLLSWRSESGGDRQWAHRLGEMVVARGPQALWRDLTALDEQGL
jgi:acyl-CoA dehydrogenase